MLKILNKQSHSLKNSFKEIIKKENTIHLTLLA